MHVPHKDASTADHQVVKVENQWSDEDIKVMEGLEHASAGKDIKINSADATGEEGGEGGDGSGDQLQEEAEQAPELTEEELEQ